MGRGSVSSGVGWQSVRKTWVLLSSILESAVEHGYLQRNPADRRFRMRWLFPLEVITVA